MTAVKRFFFDENIILQLSQANNFFRRFYYHFNQNLLVYYLVENAERFPERKLELICKDTLFFFYAQQNYSKCKKEKLVQYRYCTILTFCNE